MQDSNVNPDQLNWRKGRRSGPNGNCVEVARLPHGGVAVRNSRFPKGPALMFTRAEWEAFTGDGSDDDGVKGTEFDYLLA